MLAEKFRGAFEQEWAERIEDSAERERMACAFRRDGSWTEFMLGWCGEPLRDGFLHAVGKRLDRCVSKEWYTLDCVFYRREPNLIGKEGYPAGLDVIVEHENGERVEEGMWKLLMWPVAAQGADFLRLPRRGEGESPGTWTHGSKRSWRPCGAWQIEMHERWPEYQSNRVPTARRMRAVQRRAAAVAGLHAARRTPPLGGR